jgi:purine-binding chemotaxis protein CheW
MRCLSFFTGDEFYAVDVTLVQKVTRKMTVTPIPTAPDAIVGIANIKGRVVTLLSLCELLGRKRKQDGDAGSYAVDAVIFKPFHGGGDQIGLVIEKRGNLIDINDNAVSLPSLTAGTEENFCISGIAEADNKLYRIISINSIIERYKHAGDKIASTTLNGGNENDK